MFHEAQFLRYFEILKSSFTKVNSGFKISKSLELELRETCQKISLQAASTRQLNKKLNKSTVFLNGNPCLSNRRINDYFLFHISTCITPIQFFFYNLHKINPCWETVKEHFYKQKGISLSLLHILQRQLLL